MKWVDALKKWNTSKGSSAWCIPKKKTKEHAQVSAMMRGEPVPVEVKRAKKPEVNEANILSGKRLRRPKM